MWGDCVNLSDGPPSPPQAIAANSLTRGITSLCMEPPAALAIPSSPSAQPLGAKSHGPVQAAAHPWPPATAAAAAAAGPSASTSTPSFLREHVAPPPALLSLDDAGYFAALRLPPPSPSPVWNLEEAALFNTALPNARMQACPAASTDAASEALLDLDSGEAAGAWGGWITDQAAEAAVAAAEAAAEAVSSSFGAGSMEEGITPPIAKRWYGSQRVPVELRRSCRASHQSSGGSGGGGGSGGSLFLSDSLSGSISHLSHLPAPAATLLLLLEVALVDAIPAARPLGGGAHAQHRGTFHRRQVQLHFSPEQRRVVDGDLLHLFLELPLPQQLHAIALLWSRLVEREGGRLRAAVEPPHRDGDAEEGGQGGPALEGEDKAAPTSLWMLPGGEEAGMEALRCAAAASPSIGLCPVGGGAASPGGCRGTELPHGDTLAADLEAAPEGVVFAVQQLVQHALTSSAPA